MNDDDLKELHDLEPDLLLQSCVFLVFADLIIREFLGTETFRKILAEGKGRSEQSDSDLAFDEMGINPPTFG